MKKAPTKKPVTIIEAVSTTLVVDRRSSLVPSEVTEEDSGLLDDGRSANDNRGVIGDDSKVGGVLESEWAVSEEGEGGRGIMEASVSGGGMVTLAVVDQGSEKDAPLDGISIGKAGTGSSISLLYEAMENLLNGNSELSQSVSIDAMEERREESVGEGGGGFQCWVEGEGRDSFPSSLYWSSSSTMLD